MAIVITDTRFEDTTEVLDGKDYHRCVFVRCHLIFTGLGSVGLTGCEFIDCNWSFDGPAANTIGFLRGLYHGIGDAGPKLVQPLLDSITNPLPDEQTVSQESLPMPQEVVTG